MTFTFQNDYEVLTSSDARRALELLDEKAPVAVVLSDQRMPNMSGVEFVSEVCKRHPATVRMILTGFADMQAIIDAINDGSRLRLHHQAVGAGPPEAGDEAGGRALQPDGRERAPRRRALARESVPRSGDGRPRHRGARRRRRGRDRGRESSRARLPRARGRSAREAAQAGARRATACEEVGEAAYALADDPGAAGRTSRCASRSAGTACASACTA